MIGASWEKFVRVNLRPYPFPAQVWLSGHSDEPIDGGEGCTSHTGYGRNMATPEQVVAELQSQSGKEVAVSFQMNAPIDGFSVLITALQKQGMKVGFITSPGKR